MYRAQARALRRTSLLGPLLLIVLGVMFLLLEMGRVQPVVALQWVGRWWPLVLVGAGVVLVAEWALDSATAGRHPAPVPRRTLGGLGTLLLLVLAAIGVGQTLLAHGSDWAQRSFGANLPPYLGLDDMFAQHSETDLNLSAPLTKGAVLQIQNFHGNIVITGSSQDGQVHVSAHQRTWAWQADDLRRRQERDRPQFIPTHGGLRLQVEGDARDETDLTLEVPHETSLEIAPEKGDLNVTEVRGPLAVEDHRGNVTLTALTGNVHITSRDDNASIVGHSITGNVALDGRSGDISLSDVTGPVTLRGDFFGTTHLERLQGALHFQSSYTDLACAGVHGELNVEGRSDLNATDLDGPVTLTTSDRNVRMTGLGKAGATVRNRNGSVTLGMTSVGGPIDVENKNGSVEVQVPEKAAFQLTAETANGDIENDLHLSTTRTGDRVTLTGQVGAGGPTVNLRTSDGDIKVRHSAPPADTDDSDDK